MKLGLVIFQQYFLGWRQLLAIELINRTMLLFFFYPDVHKVVPLS
jgi:hypothetical protein